MLATTLTEEEVGLLARAKRKLEKPSLAMRLANAAGAPVERLAGRLPEPARRAVGTAVGAALGRALEVAVATLGKRRRDARTWTHRIAVAVTGAAGGAFGVAGLAVELPVTTTVMLRSIADQARAHGEDLGTAEARMECLAVLGLGARTPADSGYFAARVVLAGALREAAAHVARGGVGAAPPLARLMAVVAARFGVAVEEKALAQLLPVVGAVGGAAINTVFIAHFQEVADAHFAVRGLERMRGAAAVREAYAAA